MTDPTEPAPTEPAGDRIVAVTVDDPILGAPLRLALAPQRTVLVGKNGAGKSRLLENFHDAAFAAVNARASIRQARVKLEVELEGARFTYEYVVEPYAEVDRGGRTSWRWSETCVDASGVEIWRVGDERAVVGGELKMPLPPQVGLIHLRFVNSAYVLPPQVESLRRLLLGVYMMRAGVPRHAPIREALRLQRSRRTAAGQPSAAWSGQGDVRLIEVIQTLAFWSESEPDRFDAVVEIGRRLQVLRELVVQVEDLDVHANQPQLHTQEATVFVDGVNFGYLSDGTQRLIELVIKLVDPDITVLLLEEPETSVHMGLLRRLLAELEALGPGKQVVISTHSPAVLDWSDAVDVRLVERTAEGATSVRSLSAGEQERVRLYLHDDLGLSDFVFSGAMD